MNSFAEVLCFLFSALAQVGCTVHAVAAQDHDLPMKKASEYRYLEAFILTNGRVKGFEPSTPCTPCYSPHFLLSSTQSEKFKFTLINQQVVQLSAFVVVQHSPASYTLSHPNGGGNGGGNFRWH